jgi:four helix bundle protein
MEQKYNLAERLIDFAVAMIKTAERLPKSFAGNHLAGQLTRSGTSPALHYGEALSAESRNDFIHKMKVALKELRETLNCLKIINRIGWLDSSVVAADIKECNELTAIFVKSVVTAEKNKTKHQNQITSTFNIRHSSQ